MQRAAHLLIERFRLATRAGAVMLVAMLALVFSVHAASCTSCRSINDDHSTARISRAALGDVQAVLAKTAAYVDAASGAGSSQIALPVATALVAAPSVVIERAVTGADFSLAAARNTALAHRAVTVLLI